jgi:hypothetical protein
MSGGLSLEVLASEPLRLVHPEGRNRVNMAGAARVLWFFGAMRN